MKAGKKQKLSRGWILVLALLYLAHNDFWNWENPGLFLGLPIVLVYHVLYCLTVALIFYALTDSLGASADSSGESE